MEAIGVITLLGWFLVGVGLLLTRLPVGTCPECEHCRMIARRRELEQDQEEVRRAYGVSRCARCGEYHRIGGPC